MLCNSWIMLTFTFGYGLGWFLEDACFVVCSGQHFEELCWQNSSLGEERQWGNREVGKIIMMMVMVAVQTEIVLLLYCSTTPSLQDDNNNWWNNNCSLWWCQTCNINGDNYTITINSVTEKLIFLSSLAFYVQWSMLWLIRGNEKKTLASPSTNTSTIFLTINSYSLSPPIITNINSMHRHGSTTELWEHETEVMSCCCCYCFATEMLVFVKDWVRRVGWLSCWFACHAIHLPPSPSR